MSQGEVLHHAHARNTAVSQRLFGQGNAGQDVELVDEYRIRAPSPQAPLEALSGGNVQRVVLARELSGAVCVLVVANPCFGLDFLTAAQIRDELRAQRDRGVAVLLISEDLDEILMLSDRIAVISSGRIVMEADAGECDRLAIGTAMAAHGHLADPRLDGCAVYASGHPCPMCLSAMHMVGISEVYYAYSNDDAEKYGMSTARIYAEMAKPLAQQSIKIEYVPVRGDGESPYAAWQRIRTS